MKIFVLSIIALLFFVACDSSNDPGSETKDSDLLVIDDDEFTDVDEIIFDEDLLGDIDIEVDNDSVLSDEDLVTDPCDPNPCNLPNRTVCKNSDGVADCLCDEGFVLDLDNNDSCINSKTVQCDSSATPENAEFVNVAVEINWNGTEWSLPKACQWECVDGYTEENDVCINKKSVECDHSALIPENSEFVIADVEIGWDGTKWSDPEVCKIRCLEGYTSENEECINQKAVLCSKNIPLPDNAQYIDEQVNVMWNGNAWSAPVSCRTECLEGYTFENEECINQKAVLCSKNIPLPDNAQYVDEQVNVMWNGNAWSVPASCRTECLEGYTSEDGGCINEKTVLCREEGLLIDNSEFVLENVNVTWNGQKWSDADVCKTRCKNGFTYENEECINQKLVNCDDSSIPPNSDAEEAAVTIAWDGTKWSDPTKCKWICKEEAHPVGEDKCIIDGDTAVYPFGPYSADFSVDGNTSSKSFNNDYEGSCKTTLHPYTKDNVYAITLNANSFVTVNVSSTTMESIVYILTDTSEESEVECANGNGENDESIIKKDLDAGTYYIVVDGATYSDEGTYSISVTIDNPCEDATVCSDLNKTVCSNSLGVAVCSCDEGFHADVNGDCVSDNLCEPNPCEESHKTNCTVENDSYTCGCDDGFEDNGSGVCVALGSSCTNPMVAISESGDYSGKIAYSLGLTTFKPDCGVYRGGDGMIYKLVLSESSTVSVNMEDMPFSPAVSIRKICNDDSVTNELACSSATSDGSSASINTKLSTGDYYLIINDNGSYGAGDFTFNVDISSIYDPCLPVNSCTDINKTVCSDTDLDGVAECACDEGYHDEGGNCESDTRSIECVDNHPENSVPVIATFYQEWSGSEWPETLECEWSCNDGFVKNGNVCDAETICNTPSNPCIVEHKTVCTPVDSVNYTCSCDEGYEDDGMSGCKNSSFAAEGCTDIDAVAAVTTSMTFNDSTASASNDYYQSYTGKGNDHFYKMILTESKSVTINLSAVFDTVVFYGTDCGESSMTKVDSEGSNATETVTQTFEAGIWYIVVDGYGLSNNGDYTLEFIFN